MGTRESGVRAQVNIMRMGTSALNLSSIHSLTPFGFPEDSKKSVKGELAKAKLVERRLELTPLVIST